MVQYLLIQSMNINTWNNENRPYVVNVKCTCSEWDEDVQSLQDPPTFWMLSSDGPDGCVEGAFTQGPLRGPARCQDKRSRQSLVPRLSGQVLQ